MPVRRLRFTSLLAAAISALPLPSLAFDGVVLWRADARVAPATAVAGHADPVAATGTLSAETPLHVGSITKLFTAVLVMQQVQAARITLDAPIAGWLPELSAAAGHVTVQQLLQHRSGLPEWQAEEDAAGVAVPAIPTAQLEAAVLAAAAAAPRAAPGGDFHYNNLDYLLLALVLERATGQSYPALLSARILKPLGMRKTHLLVKPPAGDARGSPRSKKPVPAATIRDGKAVPAPVTALANYGAAGALVSTAADLSRFAGALLGDRLLSKAARETLFVEGLSVWRYAFADPALPAPVAAVERQGSVGAYRSTLVLLPERGGWLIVLANSDAEDYSTWMPVSFTHRLLTGLLVGQAPSLALAAALEVKSAAPPAQAEPEPEPEPKP